MAIRDVRMLSFLLERLSQRVDRLTSPLSAKHLSDFLAEEDFIHVRVQRPDGSRAEVAALSDLVDRKSLQQMVLTPLSSSQDPIASVLPLASSVDSMEAAKMALLSGNVLIFASEEALALPLGAYPKRQVDTPEIERALLGPKDAFIEDLDTNVALLRRHLPDKALVVHRLTLGTLAPKPAVVLWLTDAADPKIPGAILERLTSEMPPRVTVITELLPILFGSAWSPFLRSGFGERPGYVASQLIRGRVALLMDSSPMAMILPHSVDENLKDDESSFPSSSVRLFVRLMRILALAGATLLPGFFVAVLTINTRVLPTLLAVEVAFSRQPVPYPVFTETLLLLIVLDVLSESTISMKGVLGPAISIVGSLIIGQAAVQANLASTLSVILVAITALGTFITPWFQNTYGYRIAKYPILVLSALLGLVGWAIGVFLLATHLAGLRAFGVSYLTPIAPFKPAALASSSSLGAGTLQRETGPYGSGGSSS